MSDWQCGIHVFEVSGHGPLSDGSLTLLSPLKVSKHNCLGPVRIPWNSSQTNVLATRFVAPHRPDDVPYEGLPALMARVRDRLESGHDVGVDSDLLCFRN